MRSREEYQDINLKAKETYPGFIANIEYTHSQYIITIDPNLQLDKILFNKFKQAALKGLAD